MEDKYKQFIRLHVIEDVSIQKTSETLNIPRKTLSMWYEESKLIREGIADIRKLWNRKKLECNFSQFYDWYTALERKCAYCSISEEEIQNLLSQGKLETKRIATRGKRLELDRKQPNDSYNNLENLTLCCYWCNNAKTDTFTHEEFIEIGKSISSIWKLRLKGE